MEEHVSAVAVTHLLQHTLRSLCIHENSEWVYAVFWRILPRNYPPPKWEGQAAYDRSRGNRRNWILVWEDGFCNFAASASGECPTSSSSSPSPSPSSLVFHPYQGLQPDLFFKMSHEIYNYGEGLIGKVAADHSHKWIYKEPNDQEINFLSAWHNSADSHPRTWEAQFQSGIKTIALIAVREGVVQLGALHKVIEDLSYVVLLRKKFSYIESIPGVLLPHPSSSSSSSSSSYPYTHSEHDHHHHWHPFHQGTLPPPPPPPPDHHHHQFKITPSMSSLEALLSKLPSVVPPHTHPLPDMMRPLEFMAMHKVAKEELHDHDLDHHHHHHHHHHDHHEVYRPELDLGETSTSMHHASFHHLHQDHNNNNNNNNNNTNI